MTDVDWARYPRLAVAAQARTWLTIQANLQLAPNTVAAYARALEEYLAFSARHQVAPESADGTVTLSLY